MYRFYLKLFFAGLSCFFFTSVLANPSPDPTLNDALFNAMKTYQVPVVGYAIIKNDKIVAADTLSIDPTIQVSTDSLFQAASISKSVTAYGALKLVQQKQLQLDQAVNQQLRTWQIPTNEFNKDIPVTLRNLLDMTSGLAVAGFPGHPQRKTLPTMSQVLDGVPPANTAAIRVFYTPGTRYFYSGGAFEVLEKLMEDTTKKPFQEWMKQELLQPLDMTNSIFQYPLEQPWQTKAVPGFLMDGSKITDGWYNYESSAAAGLWSTPIDIAKFSINISQSYQGNDSAFLSKPLAQQMLTRQNNTDFGLGVVINGEGRSLNFRKAGHNLGYHSELLMFPHQGDGVVIMTNSENGTAIIDYIIPLIAQKYQFPCYFPYFDELITIPKQAC